MADIVKQTKPKKVKPIPSRQIDFYYRMQRTPEKLAVRHRKRMIGIAASFAVIVMVVIEGALLWQFRSVERQVQELRDYVTDSDRKTQADYADELTLQSGRWNRVVNDVSNAVENAESFPLVTSKVLERLEESCPDKVQITITGYNSVSGQLLFDAAAPLETDISDAIIIWRDDLGIFEDVYYTGYTESYDSEKDQEIYKVKVVCILKEETGK